MVKEVVIETQDVTFNACVKIAMAYTRPLNNDADLKFMFDTLNDVKNFVQKIAHEKGISDKNYEYVLGYINELNLRIDTEMHKRNIDKNTHLSNLHAYPNLHICSNKIGCTTLT